jgi:hypothetical protein
MAWLGQPVLIEELLFNTEHGIVDQSLHARIRQVEPSLSSRSLAVRA